MPTRGFAAWQAVTITIVSPERTMTAPSACLASLPVSIETVRRPIVISRRYTAGVAAMIGGVLLPDAELLDEVGVRVGVLALEVIEQPPALLNQAQQAAP